MQLSQVINQAESKYPGVGLGAAIQQVSVAFGVQNNSGPLTAEEFAIKLHEIFVDAETALPTGLKQNNFSYGISESGKYRGTLSAIISTSNIQVIG